MVSAKCGTFWNCTAHHDFTRWVCSTALTEQFNVVDSKNGQEVSPARRHLITTSCRKYSKTGLRRNSWASWQDNGIAYAPTSGRGRRDRQSRSVTKNYVPCVFGDREPPEKPKKNDDDDDGLFDRAASP